MSKNHFNDVTKTTIKFNVDYNTKNYGSFKVLGTLDNMTDCYGDPMYLIQFNYSGFQMPAALYSIQSGSIKDPYYPAVFGVACCGVTNMAVEADHKTSTREYTLWYGMIARCYNPKCPEFMYYGAKGVTVCPKWLCFEYFLVDLPLIPGYDLWKSSTIPREYQLEKDYKQMNSPECKIYSLETCYFSSQYSNKMIKSVTNADKYTSKYIGVNEVKYPNGEIRYESYIWVNAKKISLGFYLNEEAAAQARDSAALQFYNNDVILNNAPGLSSAEMDALCTSRKDCSKYYLRPMIKIKED